MLKIDLHQLLHRLTTRPREVNTTNARNEPLHEVNEIMNTSVGKTSPPPRIRAIIEFKPGVKMANVQEIVLAFAMEYDEAIADVRFEHMGQFK
jgi:hypothetical protein